METEKDGYSSIKQSAGTELASNKLRLIQNAEKDDYDQDDDEEIQTSFRDMNIFKKIVKNKEQLREQVELWKRAQSFVEFDEHGNNKFRVGDSLNDQQKAFWNETYKKTNLITAYYDEQQQYRNLEKILIGGKSHELKLKVFELKVSEIKDVEDDIVDLLNEIYKLLNSKDIDFSSSEDTLTRTAIIELKKITATKIRKNMSLILAIRMIFIGFVKSEAEKLDEAVEEILKSEDFKIGKCTEFIKNEKIQEFVLNKIDVSKYEEIAEGYIAKLEKVIDDYILKEYEDQKDDVNNVNIKKTIGVIKKG